MLGVRSGSSEGIRVPPGFTHLLADAALCLLLGGHVKDSHKESHRKKQQRCKAGVLLIHGIYCGHLPKVTGAALLSSISNKLHCALCMCSSWLQMQKLV